MSLNFKKVKNYIAEKLEKEYKNYYPAEIFQDLQIEVNGGSFGSCLISIRSNAGKALYSVDYSYVRTYADIDAKISDFVIRNYERIAEKVYREYKKECEKKMSYKLTIYNDGKVVNTIESEDPRVVKSEFIKITIAEKRRGVKTRWIFDPYISKVRIVQKFDRERYGLTNNVKYEYIFNNMDF